MLQKTDNQLRTEVLSELHWDTHLWPYELEVKVDDGIVTLTGEVPSYAHKVAAQNAAHRITGVLDVANDITVKVPRKHPDTDIAQAVRDALEWDVMVPDEEIKTTVSNGWVTLEGSVGNMRESEDVLRALERLEGVIGVTNNLHIRPRTAKAENLRAEIEAALERRADREAERLRIEVKDDEVNLYGRVHSWREKRAVLGSIIHAQGVKKVNDHLRIDPYF